MPSATHLLLLFSAALVPLVICTIMAHFWADDLALYAAFSK